MCRDWGTNTRKIKSNIDKYIVEQQLKYLLSTKNMRYVLYRTDITYCLLRFGLCHGEARDATIHNDNALRTSVAQKWSALNHVEIRPEDINCVGCRVDGIKTSYCDRLCPIRRCALQRGVPHCGACPDMSRCDTLRQLTDHAPQALHNLTIGT